MSPQLRRTIITTLFDPFSGSSSAVRRVLALPLSKRRLVAAKSASSNASGAKRTFIAYFNGFNSVQSSTKPTFLLQKCIERTERGQKLGFLGWDYSGHGSSASNASNSSEELNPIPWKECGLDTFLSDSLGALDALTGSNGRTEVYLVGTSMGAWIATLAASALLKAAGVQVKGMLLIAPAFDFTEFVLSGFSDLEIERLKATDSVTLPSAYDPSGYTYTKRLFDSGRELSLFDGSNRAESARGIPVSFLWARDDPDIPQAHFEKCKEWFEAQDVREVVVLETGGHRLSGPGELEEIWRGVEKLMDGSKS